MATYSPPDQSRISITATHRSTVIVPVRTAPATIFSELIAALVSVSPSSVGRRPLHHKITRSARLVRQRDTLAKPTVPCLVVRDLVTAQRTVAWSDLIKPRPATEARREIEMSAGFVRIGALGLTTSWGQ
jgi:hypothetical protein